MVSLGALDSLGRIIVLFKYQESYDTRPNWNDRCWKIETDYEIKRSVGVNFEEEKWNNDHRMDSALDEDWG